MIKKQCLKPWAVARLLPNGKWVIIGRYHNCSDAEGHLQLLGRRVANIQFKVVFDLADCCRCDRRSLLGWVEIKVTNTDELWR
jgi:hypothetical protein